VPATGTTTLSFFVLRRCYDTYRYDQQQAFLLDGEGYPLVSLFDTCGTDSGWKRVTVDLSPYAGQSVYLYFNDHDDGYSTDPTWFYVDDVVISSG
jgi:hypothetical protein